MEKYIHENCLWGFVCFYTLLFLFMCVPTCDMLVELKDNLGEFLLLHCGSYQILWQVPFPAEPS